jgi:hypothetical protein
MASANILGSAIFIEIGQWCPASRDKDGSYRYSPVLHTEVSYECGNLLDLYDYEETHSRKVFQREKSCTKGC